MTRTFKQTAEFSNFICHFGNKDLLDCIDEIVLPTFTTANRVRVFGASKYFLLNVSLVKIGDEPDSQPAIVGRFVVDTEITRSQVFKDGQLVDSPRTMETAPSSVFALLLDNHKLLYAKEVPGGPGIAAFRTTLEILLNRRRLEYINGLYLNAKRLHALEQGPKLGRSIFNEAIPKADLSIVPLLGETGMNEFLSRFSVLKELQIRVLKPNSEIDNDGLFDDLQKARENVNAESTTLVHRNSEGLEKIQAAKQAAPAMHGNAIVKFVGLGPNSEKFSGSNEDFKVVSQPLSLPENPIEAGKSMLTVFKGMLRDGLIRIADGAVSPEHISKLNSLFDK